MDEQKELELWLSLIHRRNPSLRQLNRLLQAERPGKSLLDLPPDEMARFVASAIDVLPAGLDGDPRSDIDWLQGAPDRSLLPISDPRYPWLLREIPDPPLALFVIGNPACLNRPCLSVVGSRNATPQGRETAKRLARELAGMGFTVVSGLAVGIDACAHRGALKAGTTLGICAHGLDTVYPLAHRQLAMEICGGGALVSEFATGVAPRRHNFPQRNRIISGMSLGTLVVEAGLRSGSLITARLAVEQNREVFAVPGPISSPYSRGCHELIKKGARLLEDPEDVLEEIGQYCRCPPCVRSSAGSPSSPGLNARFLDHMGFAPCTRDELVQRSGLTPGEVSSMLLRLELDGWVELCPGGTYVRIARS